MGSLNNLCRLCSIKLESGFDIFLESEDRASLMILINKYLPIKVAEDEILPRQICEPCHVGVATTVDLIDRMAEGQHKLLKLWKQEKDRRAARVQVEALRNYDGENQPVRKELPTTLVDIQGDRPESEMNDLAKGFDIKKIYDQHPLNVVIQGDLTKRRRRGRPRKGEGRTSSVYLLPSKDDLISERPRRKTALPSRFRDSAVADKDDDDEGSDTNDTSVDSPTKPWDSFLGHSDTEIFNENETQMSTTLDGNTVIVTANHEEPIPAAVNIKLSFKDEIGFSLPKASIYSVQPSKSGRLVPSKSSKVKLRKRGRQRQKWTCHFCLKSFSMKGKFLVHLRNHKSVVLQCQSCLEKFASREDIDLHQESFGHSGFGLLESDKSRDQPINCPLCASHTFPNVESYEVHVASVHESQKPFCCSICKKRFASRGNLKGHYALHESTHKRYQFPCDLCAKIFSSKSSLNYHTATVHSEGKKKFLCTICDASFSHKLLVQRHLSSVHSENRPHSCKICSKSFKMKSHLFNHGATHEVTKRFTCELCGKRFSQRGSLTIHLKIHSGIKPFKCSDCDREFTQKGNLKEHRRIHTGEKPFCCSTCGKTFTTSSQLRLHEQSHNRGAKFVCLYCPRAFTKERALRNHESQHKFSEPEKTLKTANNLNISDLGKRKAPLSVVHWPPHPEEEEPPREQSGAGGNVMDLISLESPFIYIVTKKENEVDVLTPFGGEIFSTDEENCSKAIGGPGPSAGLQSSFVCQPIEGCADNPGGDLGGVGPPQNLLSVVLPDSEDASLCMRKMFESAGISQ